MMSNAVRMVVLAVALFLSFGCDHTFAGGFNSFFPSVPGTMWKYSVTYYPNGSSPAPIMSELSITITSNEMLSIGGEVARWNLNLSDSTLRGWIFPFGDDSVVYVGQFGDSVLLFRSLQDSAPSNVLLRLSLALGRSWGVDNSFSFFSIIDSVGSIDAPAGLFENCIQIGRIGGWWQAPLVISDWVKESVGFIRFSHFLVGLSSEGFTAALTEFQIGSTSVDGGEENGTPLGFILAQNYPNPFNAGTEIQYGVPKNEYIRLKVYNILGLEMATLVDGYQPAGSYTTRWEPASVPSGVYFYRLAAGQYIRTKAMLLQK